MNERDTATLSDLVDRGVVRFLGDLAKLQLSPGEVLVLRSPHRLSAHESAEMADSLKSVFPDNRVIVLGDGLELAIVSAGVIA